MWLKYVVSVFGRFSTRYFGTCHFFSRYCGIGYPLMSPPVRNLLLFFSCAVMSGCQWVISRSVSIVRSHNIFTSLIYSQLSLQGCVRTTCYYMGDHKLYKVPNEKPWSMCRASFCNLFGQAWCSYILCVIIVINVNYNYHKNYPKILWGTF